MDDLAEVTSHNSWPGQKMTERMSDLADLKEDKLTNRIAWIPGNAVVPRAEEPDPTSPSSFQAPSPKESHRHFPVLGLITSNGAIEISK